METTDQANAFVTDAWLTKRLNRNLRLVYAMLVKARGSGYYRSETTFSTVAGTQLYALPATFMELLDVRLEPSTTDKFSLVEAQDSEVAALEAASQSWPSRYQLRAGNIAMLPTPTTVVSVRLVYVPAFVALVADADTFDGVCGFEEAAVWRTVAEMLSKDTADPSFALLRVAEWDKHIGDLAQKRAVNPPRVNRTYRKRWWST